MAIRLVTRATAVDHNLNRLFSEEHLAGPVLDFYESGRAHELAPILATADISIDIHSTALPSMPFLANLFGAKREKVYRWFDTDILLADPDFILGGHRASTDEYVESCGGIGISFETGGKGHDHPGGCYAEHSQYPRPPGLSQIMPAAIPDQMDLFAVAAFGLTESDKLMQTLDGINRRFPKGVAMAAAGFDKTWKPKAERVSRR